MKKTFSKLISSKLNLKNEGVYQTILLLEDGATVPFISRYRKEATGSLDDIAISDIAQNLKKLKDISSRKETILKAIEEQEKLTPSLRVRIEATWDLAKLEDIYLPFKKKRKTRGMMAKEKGLEPLAEIIFRQGNEDPISFAKKFISNKVANAEDALQGARDIIAEWINESEPVRSRVRQVFRRSASIQSKMAKGKEEEGVKYKDYFKFEQLLTKCPSHRLLAMRRAEEEGILKLKIQPPEEDVLYAIEKIVIKNRSKSSKEVLLSMQDSYKRLLCPSIETEFRNLSKEVADKEAIQVFGENLKQLLLSPPLGQKRILALDPGYKSGCKLVCLDEKGDLLHYENVFPHPPQNKLYEAKESIIYLVDKHNIEAIAIGNGTASRESMAMCKSINFEKEIEIILVSEAGASVYSASKIAREEFPKKDVTVRGAISIGRRLMDPLAELVKIDPKSIGVGQYQHDVNQNMLQENLDHVVANCVNSIGVNLNTASKHLLTYISGLGPQLAQNIIDFRTENGSFESREQLKKVKRMGAKAYEQSAGFLRISKAKNPLDNSAVHPERYKLVNRIAKELNADIKTLVQNDALIDKIQLDKYIDEKTGLPTLKDIVKELKKPGLDPRGRVKGMEFHKGIKSIEDLNTGMIVPGLVTNITKFGAFVNIGIKQDGMIHISELANKFVKDPAEIVKLQQQIQVKILEVDIKRNRVQLSLKQANS